MSDVSGVYAQFGCGLSAPDGWRNYDSSPTLRLQRLPLIGARFRGGAYPVFPAAVEFGDIVIGLPLPASSCSGVYGSHVLEHLSLNDLRTALANVLRVLEPGGVFRLVVPDLETLTRDYLSSNASQPASEFMRAAHLGHESRARGLSGLLRGWLGNSLHLWMWDERSMAIELANAGFKAIRRAQFGDCSDARFGNVEDPARWERCLGMECRKG